ncbi:outer membrane transport energization protein ExbD [Variovorax sp. OK605]|jgi:biopolymer transport protein ExbD|uniref:ExbD/TolR family protein n=1 Tax=unclassified Variovorax TaxID=663243 RepID=UPI0008B21234|nr:MULTISPECIES: biopolymer transporter ExbD [unclassified Variovorax]SEK10420.1 outer membrane transport energization protein ExbD [Variovorax sp. OK202]SFD68224.1 outer membrane transport energization protein ExbD [Variovorax sp. OK212]SFQ10001.1 outer membrane transport energization protein ExbD [Variovorax sp. OK605]
MRKEKQGRRSGAPSDEPMMDINTTPLIDVMLVLLIMLIITIPIQLHAVNLNMPNGNPPPSDLKPEVLRIDIDARSTVLWNGEAVAELEEVERRFEQVAAQPVQPEVHLRPDKQAKYNVVAGVMASAQRSGLTKLGIMGSEQFIP